MKPDPTPTELIAQELRKISKALQEIATGSLRRCCIVTLLHDSTKLPKKDITAILDGLASLEADYCQ